MGSVRPVLPSVDCKWETYRCVEVVLLKNIKCLMKESGSVLMSCGKGFVNAGLQKTTGQVTTCTLRFSVALYGVLSVPPE